jgi:hypothetical protein
MPTNDNTGLPNLVDIPKGYQPLNSAGMDLANLAMWHWERIGNTGMLAAPPEGAANLPMGMPANPVATSQRVWVNEPPGSVPFHEKGAINIAGAPTPGINQTVLMFRVPDGFDGVIKYISNNISDPGFVEGSGDLIWMITINGRPVRNFGNIVFQNGTTAQGLIVSPIRVFSGQTVAFTVQYAAGAIAGQAICSLSGYYYPSKGIS